MNQEFIYAIDLLCKEKGISKDYIFESLKHALLVSYKKQFGAGHDVRIEIDQITGTIEVYKQVTIVSEVTDSLTEMSLIEAQAKWPEAEEGDCIEFPGTPKDFGRTAAQQVKNLLVQKIKDAERSNLYEEFKVKENDIVTGVIQRVDRKYFRDREAPAQSKERTDIFVDIGKAEAVMAENETVRGENYILNKRMKFYITEVKKHNKGTTIRVSRSHPGLVRRLFEMEAPEIKNGIVEIRSIAREAGSRTKMAVFSRDEDVDPIGTCVGARGTRVQNVVNELNGEKIDIIKWNVIPEEFIASALSPSKVIRVDILDEGKSARVIVPDGQLSLAIGKDGQNARLSAKLTGWKIDIKSESQFMEELNQRFDFDDDYDDYEDDDNQASQDEQDWQEDQEGGEEFIEESDTTSDGNTSEEDPATDLDENEGNEAGEPESVDEVTETISDDSDNKEV